MDAAELRLLSLLLGAPAAGALELLREESAHFPWLNGPLAELAHLPLDRWQGEHTRLFIAGFPHTPCPPFASTWVEKRMHGTPMESLMLFYRRLGLEAEGMPADFLGTILECAALLEEQPPGERDAADALWREHLLPWLSGFAAALEESSRLEIYRALARRLNEIAHDYRMATAATGAA